MESAYQANPRELAKSVPNTQEEPSQDDLEYIRTNLLPMNDNALNSFMKERGLSPEEEQNIKKIIADMRSAPTEMAPRVIHSNDEFFTPGVPEQVSQAAGANYYANVKPSELLSKVLDFGEDIAIGAAADIPATGLALGTAAFGTAFGAPLAAAGAVGAGVGAGAAALGLTEGTENFIRETLGLDPVEYGPLMTGLSMLGPIFGAFGSKAARTVKTVEASKQAAKGALALRQAASKIADKLADSKNLTGKDKVDYIKAIDETMGERIDFYVADGLDDIAAAKKALEDIPLLEKAGDYVEKFLGNTPDIPQSVFEKLQPGIASFASMEAASKARMTRSLNDLSTEVVKGIEMAKKGKVSFETAKALQIPQSEVLSGFEKLLTEATPSLPRTAKGEQVVFAGGKFKVRTNKGVLKDFTDSQYKQYFESAIKSNDYLDTLLNYYNIAYKSNFRVSAQKGVKTAIAGLPTSQTLAQLAELRRRFAQNFPLDASGAAGLAHNRAYSSIKQLEDKYLAALQDSGIPSLSSAATQYSLSKEMSDLAASSFKQLSDNITADPTTLGSAILKLPNEIVEKFVRLKRGEAALGSQIVNENLPQYMARQVLQEKFGSRLFSTSNGLSGIPSRERIANIPKVLEEIVQDKNLNLKMKTLLGEDTWKSMLKDMKKASDIFVDIGTKMVLAREKGNSKLASTLQANIATKMLQLVTPAGSVSRSFWITKSMIDYFGDSVIKNKVNQLVYSKNLPEVVNAITSTRMAAQEREKIIAAFGKDNPVGLSILMKFDEQAQRKLLSMENVRKMLLLGQAKNLPELIGEGREPGVPSGQPQREYQ